MSDSTSIDTNKNNSFLEKHFKITERKSTVSTEVIAGITCFLAMVYSVIVVPGWLAAAGFPAESVYIATCLVTAIGSIAIGAYSNLPLAIGVAISLTAFTAFSLVLGQKVPVETALAAIVVMGLVFFAISATGVRSWLLRNIPHGIAHGTAIGIGMFLLFLAAKGVGITVADSSTLLKLGDFTSLPVLLSLFGLFLTIALEAKKVKGGVLIVIILLTIVGLIFDPNVKYNGLFKFPTLGETNLFFAADFSGFNAAVAPAIFALVMTAVFDATGSIRAVAGQAGLVDEKGNIEGGNKALNVDSLSSVLAGFLGTAPGAVYIESGAGVAAGGKTGLTAVVVGVLFALMLFCQPLAFLVPSYATAPALMYIGLLMLSNVTRLDFTDIVGALSGLVTAVFIFATANIVTGIMVGFCCVVVGRVATLDFKRLNVGTVIIAVALFAFYASGSAI